MSEVPLFTGMPFMLDSGPDHSIMLILTKSICSDPVPKSGLRRCSPGIKSSTHECVGRRHSSTHDTHQDRIQGARCPSKQSKGVIPRGRQNERRAVQQQLPLGPPKGLTRGPRVAEGRSVNEPLAFSRVALLRLKECRLQAAHPAPTGRCERSTFSCSALGGCHLSSPPLPSPPRVFLRLRNRNRREFIRHNGSRTLFILCSN